MEDHVRTLMDSLFLYLKADHKIGSPIDPFTMSITHSEATRLLEALVDLRDRLKGDHDG